ncbi:hypothetical protein WJX84_004825 [Apatococcus fuscideae]|uniref:Sacsin/Nov domain-containing protein n=1 Tax=Apatococcus fuscideae TaxID=2026836 RepID=A0AAW1SU44_9CHLO
MDDFFQDFGPTISLTTRIKEVLAEYGAGLTPLLELLQNADDAGASKCSFMLDWRTHSKESLAYDKLAPFQGPSLLVYNDAIFTPDDFLSISQIGESIKRTQEGKTGRFGLGFVSTYSMADVVSICSVDRLCFFDPHCTHLPNISPANPGKMVNFVQHQEFARRFPDTVAPFQAFGNTCKDQFPATLFRFPLRTEAQAAASRISSEVVTPDTMLLHLGSLEAEGHEALLFLKHLKRMEILEWHQDAPEPRLRYACSVDDPSDSCLASRSLFSRLPSAGRKPITNIYQLQLLIEQPLLDRRRHACYLISQRKGGDDVYDRAQESIRALKLKLVPWAAVAAPLTIESQADAGQPGRVFCFLPLPLSLGLRVHVNGWFDLSSNRRSIWYGENLVGSTRMRSDWNLMVLKEIMAPAFVSLISALAGFHGAEPPTRDYFQLWPTNVPTPPFSFMIECFYKLIADQPVIFTAAGGGRWLSPSEAFYSDIICSRDPDLVEAFCSISVPMATLSPGPIQDLLGKFALSTDRQMSPAVARSLIAHASTSALKLPASSAAKLLVYGLSEDASVILADSDVHGLMVPLLDSSSRPLKSSQQGQPLYDTMYLGDHDDQQLFDCLADCLVDTCSLTEACKGRLQSLATDRCLNLQHFDVEAIASHLLPQKLPAFQTEELIWQPSSGNAEPSEQWLRLLWKKLEGFDDIHTLYGWALVPTDDGRLVSLQPAAHSRVVRHADRPWDPELAETCSKIGCRFLEDTFAGVAHLVRHSQPGDAHGLLDAFQALGSGHVQCKLATELSASEKHSLRHFLLTGISASTMDRQLDVLRSLPIFRHHSTAQFMQLDVDSRLPPEDMLEEVLPANFVICSKAERKILGEVLGIQQLSRADFCRQHIVPSLPGLPGKVRAAVMLSILGQLPAYLSEDRGLAELLGTTAFVSTRSGKMRAPRALYDYRSPELKSLLDGDSAFPSNPYDSEDVLASLQQLGLRTTASFETLLESAEHIVQLASANEAAAAHKGNALLGYVDLEVDRLITMQTSKGDMEDAWKQLASISWCPNQPCVLVGSGFVPPDHVAFSGPLNLAPWLYVVPGELTSFKPLLAELGVQDRFSAAQYGNVLAEMAEATSKRRLSGAELQQALSIVQALSSGKIGDSTIFVPDAEGHLTEASNCCFNDAPWMAHKDARLIHPDISNQVAAKMGARSMRSSMLSSTAAPFDVALHGATAFGQSEALTTRLRNIISAYVEGPGVLCELIQNADDATAREVSFLLDTRSFGTNSVLSPGQTKWQGPALYVHNDATFSPDDFKSISKIGQEGKLDQANATGRYGLGWSAVYNYTDLPSFASGDHIVIFDPHASHLPGVSAAQPGLKIALNQDSDMLTQFPDAFKPYLHFGCQAHGGYKGTLFRFPLRTKELAQTSEICSVSYDGDHILRLFDAFKQQSARVLLFLKSVARLNFYVQTASDQAPQLLYSASAKSDQRSQQQIKQFLGKSGSSDTKRLCKRLRSLPQTKLPMATERLELQISSVSGSLSTEDWLICNAICGGPALDVGMRGRGMLPWVGVAAQLLPGQYCEPQELQGKAYCFLPLPLTTSLPISVNGYFELSSNRRDLWWDASPAETEGISKLRCDWNLSLLEHAIAPTYALLLLAATKACIWNNPAAYYRLWLDGTRQQPPWTALAAALYKEVSSRDVLWSNGKWISPQQAMFPDKTCMESSLLTAALLANGLPVVTEMPKHVMEGILQHASGITMLTPQLVRSFLSRKHHKLQLTDQPGLPEARETANCLLQYCLSDIDSSVSEDIQQLIGLPLLISQDLTSIAFTLHKEAQDVVCLADESELALFPSAAGILVPYDSNSRLGAKLASIATTGMTNLSLISPSLLGKHLLPTLLPNHWRGKKDVEWKAGPGQPTTEQMKKLWEKLETLPSLEALEQWPLLPVRGRHLRRLHRSSQVLEEGSWSDAVDGALSKLNCKILDPKLLIPRQHEKIMKLVLPANGVGVLTAVEQYIETMEQTADELIQQANLTPHQTSQLCTFLVNEKWFQDSESPQTFVELSSRQRFLAPEGTDLALLTEDFITADSEAEADFLCNRLGVQQVNAARFLEESVFSRLAGLDTAVRDETMLAVLSGLDMTNEASPQIQKLKELSFLPSMAGDLHQACQLYDPEDDELRLLLPEAVFPSSVYCSNCKILDTLRRLGLRSLAKAEALLAAANSISESQEDASQVKRGQALMIQLSKVAEHGGDDVDWSGLRQLAFCPCMKDPPTNGLPWSESQSALAPACLTILPKHLWISSYGARVLDCPCSDALALRMEWNRPPRPAQIATHLQALGSMHKQVDDETMRQTLATAATDIYTILSEQMGGSDSDQVVSTLQDAFCIWVGDRFVIPKATALSCPLDVRPYIEPVPEDLEPFRDLFITIGVPETFDATSYQQALAAIHDEFQNEALSAEKLDLVLRLAQELAGLVKGQKPPQNVFLPSKEATMRPASALYFNDADWLEQTQTSLAHEDLSPQIAKALGCRSLRYHNQIDSSSELNCPTSERLAERLQGRLPDLEALLFHALEWADAAGSKRLEVILDERTHPTRSLLQPGLADFQGPGILIVVHDLLLEGGELAGLQDASPPYFLRAVQCRAGLGLLLSYLISDILQVISGSLLFLFDPMGKHVSTSQKDEATARSFEFAGKTLPETFADQFSVWQSALMNPNKPFNGTIIRIPLQKDRSVSKISHHTLSIEEAAAGVQSWAQKAGKSLLFLRHMSRLGLSMWRPNAITLTNLLEVRLQPHYNQPRIPFDEHEWRQASLLKFLRGGPQPVRKASWLSLFWTRGSELYDTEDWLVFASAGEGASRGMATDKRFGRLNLDPTVAIALCTKGDSRSVVEISGCYTPFAAHGQTPPDAVKSLMGFPFLIFGKFCNDLENSVEPLEQAEGERPKAAQPTQLTLQEIEAMSTFNHEMLMTCLPAAFEGAFAQMLFFLQRRGPDPNLDSLYRLLRLPGDSQPAADMFAKMCRALAKGPIFKLRAGDFVHLWEGAFLRPPDLTPGQPILGSQALDFIQRELPLFDVPWSVKAAMDASGVSQKDCKEINPPILRKMLKQRRVRENASRALQVDEAVQLFAFCLSDVKKPSAPANSSSTSTTPVPPDGHHPLSGGTLTNAGGRELFKWPGSCQSSPMDAMPMGYQQTGVFLHQKAVQGLQLQLASEQVIRMLKVKDYTLRDMAKDLNATYRKYMAVSRGTDISFQDLTVLRARLESLWHLLVALPPGPVASGAAVPAGLDDGMRWEGLESLASIPCQSGMLVRIRYRQTVVVLPPEAEQICKRIPQESDIDPEHPNQMSHAPPNIWTMAMLQGKMPLLDPTFKSQLAPVCSVPEASTPQDTILRKLHCWFDATQVRDMQMTDSEASCLYDYFVDSVPSVPAQPNSDRDFLRTLRIFPLLYSEARRSCGILETAPLAGACPMPVLRDVLGGKVSLPAAAQYSLLEHQPRAAGLLERLAIPVLSPSTLISRALLPEFLSLEEAVQKSVLDYVVRHWDVLEQNELTVALAAASFVTTDDGSFKQASQLFDPENELLVRIFADEPLFPAERFQTPAWRQVLKAAGLRCVIDTDVFKTAAQHLSDRFHVASGQAASEQEVFAVAEDLMRWLKSNIFDLSISGPFYRAVQNISFVPAVQGLPGSAESRQLLTTFSHLAKRADWPLCWTELPTAEESILPPTGTWANLGLKSPPLFSTFLHHLQKVSEDQERIAATWPAAAGSIEDACSSMLMFMKSNGITSSQKPQLRKLAFVPVANGTRLVPATSLFARLKRDLAPFAYQLPFTFVAHSEVLVQIGMESQPKPDRLLQILQGLEEQLGTGILNVNEVRSTLRVLAYLSSHLEAGKRVRNMLPVQRAQIHVPSAQMTLVPAGNCASISTAHPRLIGRVDPDVVTFAHPQLSPAVCSILKIPSLQDLVQEQLDPQISLEYLDSLQGITCEAVKQLLGSSVMAQALHTTLRAHQKPTASGDLPGALEMARQLQQASSLTFVRTCRTRIVHLASGRDAGRADVPSEVAFFASQQPPRLIIGEPARGVPLSAVLTQALSSFLGSLQLAVMRFAKARTAMSQFLNVFTKPQAFLDTVQTLQLGEIDE